MCLKTPLWIHCWSIWGNFQARIVGRSAQKKIVGAFRRLMSVRDVCRNRVGDVRCELVMQMLFKKGRTRPWQSWRWWWNGIFCFWNISKLPSSGLSMSQCKIREWLDKLLQRNQETAAVRKKIPKQWTASGSCRRVWFWSQSMEFQSMEFQSVEFQSKKIEETFVESHSHTDGVVHL